MYCTARTPMSTVDSSTSPEKVTRVTSTIRPTGWSAPQEYHSKINVDATVGRGGRYGSVATICQDSGGGFLGASAMVFNLGDPATLEACAIREGFSLAMDLNLDIICMASDCKGVAEEIKKGSAATYGAIIREIKQQISSFTSCNIDHEFRSSNVEAHNLAKHALTLGLDRHV